VAHGLREKTDGGASDDKHGHGNAVSVGHNEERAAGFDEEKVGGDSGEKGGEKAGTEACQDGDEHDDGIESDVGGNDTPKPAQGVTDGSGNGDGEESEGVAPEQVPGSGKRRSES